MTPSIYLREATLEELLAEVQTRFTSLNPVPAWAEHTVFAVTAYYGISVELLRSKRRTDSVVRARHLTMALLVKTNPCRTRAEICEVVGLEHSMYYHALRRIDERVSRFSDFRREVSEILQVIKATLPAIRTVSDSIGIEASGQVGHCRTSPRGTSGDLPADLPQCGIGAPPPKIAS